MRTSQGLNCVAKKEKEKKKLHCSPNSTEPKHYWNRQTHRILGVVLVVIMHMVSLRLRSQHIATIGTPSRIQSVTSRCKHVNATQMTQLGVVSKPFYNDASSNLTRTTFHFVYLTKRKIHEQGQGTQ